MQKSLYLSGISHATVGHAAAYAYRFNLIWISVLCHPCRAKNYRNIAVLTKWCCCIWNSAFCSVTNWRHM